MICCLLWEGIPNNIGASAANSNSNSLPFTKARRFLSCSSRIFAHWRFDNCIHCFKLSILNVNTLQMPCQQLHWRQKRSQTVAKCQRAGISLSDTTTFDESGRQVCRFLPKLFSSAQKNSQMRPVINLNCLNLWVRTKHFTMEGMATHHLLRPEDWMVKVNLKDVYFTVPVIRSV